MHAFRPARPMCALLLTLFSFALLPAARASDVLYWTDVNASGLGGPIDKQALNTLGVTYTGASSQADFVSRLQAKSWRLVILNVQGQKQAAAQAALIQYVQKGGTAITSDYSRNAALAAAFGARFTGGTNHTQVGGGTELFFGTAGTVGVHNTGSTVFATDLDARADGFSAATFENGADAIVLGNGGRTILNGFLSDTYDAAGKAARLALAQQEILFAINRNGAGVGVFDYKAHARAVLTGYVTLAAPAPAGGKFVSLTSDAPLVSVPASLFIPEGKSSALFTVRTDTTPDVYTLSSPLNVTLGLTDENLAAESSLEVLPANTARADAYVQDGTLSDTNFGTARQLLVSADFTGGSGNNRTAYLRFRVGGFHDVSKARLRLDARTIDGGTATLGVCEVSDNHWQQDTLTFNHRPGIGPVLNTAVVSGTTLTHYNVDVTDYVRAAQAHGKDVLSFALTFTEASTSVVSVISQETQDGQFRKPQLVVQGN